MSDAAVRIAMWSGPRNISTAMMRAWENRADTAVWDEPLYGPYLHATGLPHPAAAEVIAAQGSDWRPVLAACVGPVPGGKRVFFQKHMTHHLLPDMDRSWMAKVHNCFLIRRPDEVLASYLGSRDSATVEDLGFVQQAELVDHVTRLRGEPPIIIESSDVLRDPRALLGALCERLGVPFDEHMLAWPAGRRDSDGVWAPHWYDSVWRSTGFAPYRPRNVRTPAELQPIVDICQPHYERLHAMRLRP